MRDGGEALAPLCGIRVLECGGTLAGAYAGRLLADLGAEVITAQPEGGDRVWRRGPSVDASALGAVGAYLHAGKRPAVVRPEDADASIALLALAAAADIVIADLDGGLVDAAWATDLAAEHPRLVVTMLSDYGATGPASGRCSGDLLAQAFAGVLAFSTTNPSDGPVRPLRYRTALSDLFVAAHGVLAALGALYAREGDGLGDLLDVSAVEALLGNLAVALTVYTYNGVVAVSGGRRGVWPWGIFACRDGRLLLQITEDAQWRAFIEVLGDPEWGHLELFAKTSGRIEHAEAVEALVAAALAEVELEPFLAGAVEAGVPTCRLNSPTAALHWEQLRAREAFRAIDVPGHGRLEAPASPFRHLAPPATPCTTAVPPEQAVPVAEITWVTGAAPSGGAAGAVADADAAAGRPAPLHDVRVVDLSWVIAGPMAAMLLNALGAEILKVESLTRVDVIRLLGPFAEDREGLGRSGAFNQFNQGKKSVQVDPTTERGRAVLDELIASADLVLDNMRPGALARMGFPLEHLQALNPTIVATAMTGFGATGPEANRQAYGALIEALSGQVAATGLPGGTPTEIPMSLPDPCAAVHTAVAIVAALYRRRVAGQGAVLDMAMIESWNAALPDALLAAAVTGEDPPLVGNRDELAVPHGVFRCDGDFEWVAISCETDAQFRALMLLIGDDAAAADPKLGALDGRRCVEDELERQIEAWTSRRSPDEAEEALLAAGIPAGKVRKMPAIARCAHLEHRAFFTEFDHPELSVRRHAGVPWRSLRRPVGPFSAAPVLGQHTDEVLASIGYSAEVRAELRAAGILH